MPGFTMMSPKANVLRIEHDDKLTDFTLDPSPTRRVNYHSGVKRGDITTEDIRVNIGLRSEELAAKPADISPDTPRR
jgi:hypothetical protein